MIKGSDDSMDTNVSTMDDQMLYYQYGCYLLSMDDQVLCYQYVSMDVNVSSTDDQVIYYQYGCQCHLWMIRMDVKVTSMVDQVHCTLTTLLSVWTSICHLWVIKYSVISMDVKICHLWMIENSTISMDVNMSSVDDQVLCYQYGCQCVICG